MCVFEHECVCVCWLWRQKSCCVCMHVHVFVVVMVTSVDVDDTPCRCVPFLMRQIVPFAGIPVGQQNLIFQDRELSDELEMRDIPLVKGSRLKFVLGMKGGPVSARRVVTVPDCDGSWFDISDILNAR